MDVGTGGVGESDVAIDDDFLRTGRGAGDAEFVGGGSVVEGARAGELGDFAVGCEEHAELRGVLHGAVEEGRVQGSFTIVGEHSHAGGANAIDACHFFSFAPF